MEILIILILILINALFATSEIAIISSKKSRLQKMANEGSKGAQTALYFANIPDHFLSTVQIGMTGVGILTGVFGGATIAETLANYLKSVSFLAPYSEPLSFILVVIIITYLSVIFGELAPKRIALSNPEKVAALISQPMKVLFSLNYPLVTFLSRSTDFILKRLKIQKDENIYISEEEVRNMIREGARIGTFDVAEKDIVERTFTLGDKKAKSIMTPRNEIVWLDINSSFEEIKRKIIHDPLVYYPVCDGSLDRVLGVIEMESILTHYLVEGKIDLHKMIHKPNIVPEEIQPFKVLDIFKKTGIHIVMVIDEYGTVRGLISLTDILEAIVGNVPTLQELSEKDIIKREDNSYLVDGLVPVEDFKNYFHINKIPGEKNNSYHTIGGFVLNKIGRLPKIGDSFEMDGKKFEIVDMDGNRVDKVLFTPSHHETEVST